MEKVIVSENGDQEIVTLSEAEKEELAVLHAEFLVRQNAIQADLEQKTAQKQAVLAKLGLTESEIEALLS